ncbi:cell wall hydrolase [Azospirillum sp. sgz302134]
MLDSVTAPAVPPSETPPVRRRPDDAVDTLARTLWGEARGEPVRAMEGVAAVVMNRVRRARERGGWWWGGDVVSVCRKPGQFACWDPDNADRAALLAVTPADPVFAIALRIARRANAGLLPDPTGGATHVHRTGETPDWARDRCACAEIGNRLFYNDVE